MNRVIRYGKGRHAAMVGIFLIVVALIAGVAGCPAAAGPEPPVEYELTISSTEGGSVTAPGEGTFSYEAGEVVNLVAAPATGYGFVDWTGDVASVASVGAAVTTVTMNGDCSITANFEEIPVYQLTVSSTEGGSVAVPGEGSFTYDGGEVVNLVAEPDEGYRFQNWGGDVGSIDYVSDASTTITMNDNCSITANFIAQYTLTIDSTDGGHVITPGEGTFTYDAGTVVSLVAQAEQGYHLVNWTGDVTTIANVTAPVTSITMNSNYIITASFAVDLYFSADAYVLLDGPATSPLEERTVCVLLNIMTNIVVDSVRVDLPNGTSVIVPRRTDVFSPEVDWMTLFRFITCAPGMPTAGGEYVFTALDAAGEPIPGVRDTDIWVGVEPPDPPTNVRAELTEDGILVSWDQSPTIPGSFEPASDPQLGNQQLWISKTGTGESVYGANGMSTSSYLIPRDKANFIQGKDRGLSLSEMEDGTYYLGVCVHSIAPKGSLGKGCEYNCSDPGQAIIFTIEDGEITIE